ncbi:LOW QUALITY PROTEIN: ylmG homolog protein 1-2, chloroplastic [Raphanus sativus]|uniref:LOW QUALITY PROTEIN: ylmG homolog protein 1-2, chloroplastic n=1 Tax=Raphanus sativus TaxID=3726 RepID=A0A6J0MP16_RAPSA|nr:LOW QUALITY PROTEIN: ylmG homolog protein 1-2, chloroplastic [Raphanus sativus]
MAFATTTTTLPLRSSVLVNPRFHHPLNRRNPPLRLSFPYKPSFNLSLRNPKTIVSVSAAAASSTSPTLFAKPSPRFPFSDSTKSITTLAILAGTLTKALVQKLSTAVVTSSPQIQASIRVSGPLFFAAIRDRPAGYLNTPLTVVAAGLSKWLDIYSGVLMVRVLLSWFPNIPWDRQPLSAIRDLCDPYLNLFRNIIPPVFDTLDVSPLLAFAVLGTLGSILNNSR